MVLIPAYGRDYKSAAKAKADFKAGRDFIVADITHPYSGKPANIYDLKDRGFVNLRYDRLTRITAVSTEV